MESKLNERTLKTYINQAINEELEEYGWGKKGRDEKWGYNWDSNLTRKQNLANRRLNKANIKAAGYHNADEYEAGMGHGINQNPASQEQQPQQEAQIPNEYPYKSDKQKTGQFQTWFNQNMGGNLVVDGIWGPKTEAAYQQWLSQAGNLNESKRLDEKAFKRLVKRTINEMLNK